MRQAGGEIFFFSKRNSKQAIKADKTAKKIAGQGGLVLSGFLAAAAVGLMTCGLLCGALLHAGKIWRELQARRELEEAAAYLSVNLERELGVNCAFVSLKRSGVYTLADCQHIDAGKSLRFYYNEPYQGIYKRTTKLLKNSSGVNPAGLGSCKVEAWRLRRLSSQAVYLQVTLSRNGRRADFGHVIYCVNGSVSGDG